MEEGDRVQNRRETGPCKNSQSDSTILALKVGMGTVAKEFGQLLEATKGKELKCSLELPGKMQFS